MKKIYDCLIPVGGCSSRMGEWKPALNWGSGTVIERVVSEAKKAGCRVIVLGGYNFSRLEAIFERNSGLTREDVAEEGYAMPILLKAVDWELGMDATIRSGLDALRSDRFFIVPGDMPLIRSDDYIRLASFESRPIVRPVFGGKPGHPVLLDRSMAEVIKTAASGTPIRELMHENRTFPVLWGHGGVVWDLDSAEDYAKFR
ncbi:hypothetical protein S1OALGB6SA_1618 [Olavius algarvensis spirochete endosymbiont]|uniref:nucleotidyltransferase family protein n=1 Tax=Olavius algarvensis spirochete endosymbiont TaxID=260710 RepID=UPI000AA02512|nr:NTP transferase domain-containing protein [Olavius algarvensis spirochete endosymbiont]VDB00536.1 hypothetical protein S1OALGB6SA_1618 [Olavius algarvensis spirochete endosymbiont]